jgi:hypothetical protein
MDSRPFFSGIQGLKKEQQVDVRGGGGVQKMLEPYSVFLDSVENIERYLFPYSLLTKRSYLVLINPVQVTYAVDVHRLRTKLYMVMDKSKNCSQLYTKSSIICTIFN